MAQQTPLVTLLVFACSGAAFAQQIDDAFVGSSNSSSAPGHPCTAS